MEFPNLGLLEVWADGDAPTARRAEPGVVLSWTPDGRSIDVSSDGSLLMARPDGTGERVFSTDPPENGRLVIDWSPDGRWIVMSSPTGMGTNLYLMADRGTERYSISGTEPDWRQEGT